MSTYGYDDTDEPAVAPATGVYETDTIFDNVVPVSPYNLDQPPPQYLIGPLKTIFSAVSTRFGQLFADIAALGQQMSVQNASGPYLDAHGVLYNTPRLPGEIDDAYRPRILDAYRIGRLTIPAIQQSVTAYLVSAASSDESATPETSIVYDLQFDPARCAADAAAGFPIKMFWFVVEIDSTINIDDVFFLNYAYATSVAADPLTLFEAGTAYSKTSPNATLLGTVNRIKAGNTVPIFKTVVTIDTGVDAAITG